MVRIVGLLILVVDALAILDVWRREDNLEKRLLWTIVIILLPIAGPLAWLVISRKIFKL